MFYGNIFVMTLLCSAIYIYTWHRHYNVNISMIFAFVPIACLGHFMFCISQSPGAAITAQKITYLGSSFLQLFILLNIMDLCQIDLKKWMRTLLFAVSTAVFAGALTIGYSDIFYKSFSFDMEGGAAVLTREYGWAHTAFYAVVIVFFALGFAAILYSWSRKKQVPRTIIILLVIPYALVLLSYFVGRLFLKSLDLMPFGYLLAQVIYLIISDRINLYNVADTLVDSLVQDQSIGYVSFDFKYRYLGSNDTAQLLIPELHTLPVDDVLGHAPSEEKLRHYLDSFREDPDNSNFLFTFRCVGPDGNDAADADGTADDSIKYYKTEVSFLYEASRRRGYIITFTDDTANRKYIELLNTYNDKLQDEVDEKTRHIVEMHDNLIMSLAMMVESRDNSTGGHIKRTSEGVRILVDEMRRSGKFDLSDEFCRDVIKAAPMHDLGKIAVDDAVLRKPGRFTAEEFEKMKQHAAEGARVIHDILLNTDDESFKLIAENVAHYHHERWDGSGYPDGLAGEQIPFEARIMAIADVYDALVSKRVYKEAFGFEKANAIISEGMGTQFDPGLKPVYEKARPLLEKYYSALND